MPENTFSQFIRRTFARREATLMILLVVLLVPITIRSPQFLSPKNISTILNDMAILVIVAIGQFYVILSGVSTSPSVRSSPSPAWPAA